MNTMRHPLEYFPPEGLGAMHAGIVEHHHGEGVGVFLGYKMVKRVDDRIGSYVPSALLARIRISGVRACFVMPEDCASSADL